MPNALLKYSRWSYDLNGEPTGSTLEEVAPSGGLLPVYKNDGDPELHVSFSTGDSQGFYDYEIVTENQNPIYPAQRVNVASILGEPAYAIGEYDPDFPSGLTNSEAGLLGYVYWGATVGAYRVSNGTSGYYFGLPADLIFTYGGYYGSFPLTIGRYKVIGSVNHNIEVRELAVTNFRTERPVVDIQSRNPLVKIRGDFTVYPNQVSNGLDGWKPANPIHYRIKLRNPDFPGGEIELDGVIPVEDISNPTPNGVVASFEHVWDGRIPNQPLYCASPVNISIRAITDVEVGNTLAGAPGIRVMIVNCRAKKLQKQAEISMDLPVYGDEGADVNPTLSYQSFDSAELPASMGYGWYSTENIRVFELEDDSLVYCDEGGGWLRWLKNGTTYEPMFPDNKLSIEKNAGSSNAHYVVKWRDGTRREFDNDVSGGKLTKHVDSNGRVKDYERFASYLKVNDDKGRAVYQHYAPGGTQPNVINDNDNPLLGRRFLLEYYVTGDPAPNRLKSITDPVGDKTLFVYNAAGRITEIREVRPDEGDRSIFYSYLPGALARLVQMRVASRKLGVLTNHYLVSYAYEVPVPGIDGYLTTRSVTSDFQSGMSTPTTDKVVYLAYDVYSRVTAEFELLEILPDGSRTYLETYHEYEDPNDPFLVTKTTAPNGAITQWEYTPRGNVKKVIDAQGNETLMTYVEEDTMHPAYATFPDLVTEIRRPAPDQDNAPTVYYPTTKLGHDAANGNLLSVEDADGQVSTFSYNADGQVIRIINRRGFKTYLEYDSSARLFKVHVQKSLTTSPSITEFASEVAEDFRSVRLNYDSYDRLTQFTDANGNTIEVTYDSVGRPTTVTDGNSVEYAFEYLDRVLKEVELPDNNGPHTNRLTKIEHDALGRPVAVKRQDSGHAAELRVGFAYNGFSQLRALKRIKNGTEKSHTVDAWDRQGRALQTTDANGKSSTAEYEPYCVGFATTSARGVRRQASFDTLCRLTEVKVGTPDADPLKVAKASETHTFVHDDLGRVIKTIQNPGSRYGQARFGQSRYGGGSEERAFEFDALDRVTKVTFSDGKEMSYLYDVEGNVTQVTENASSTNPKVTTFSYYGDNKLYEVTYVRSGGNQVFRYSYDKGGRPLELRYPTSTGIKAYFSGPSGPTLEPGWDGNGQLRHLRYVKDDTTLIRRLEYLYDDTGNRIVQFDVTPTKATYWSYGYDWLDRLETVKKVETTDSEVLEDIQSLPAADALLLMGALQLVSVYQYNAADNRTEFQVPNLSDPALTETFRYSYDFADNITLIEKKVGSGSFSSLETFASDFDGNMTSRTKGGVTTSYQWDDFNRLAAISTSNNSKKQSHTFGVNGFRRKKKDKFDVETTEYAAGLATAVSKAQGGDTVTYLMGHRIMGFERSSDGAMFFYLTDSLSSVRDVVRGTDGAVMASYEFSEYGQRTSTSESGVSSQKTFVGGLSVQDEVADTGLMMMGHRFYDPSGPAGGTGRFLNRDPIGFNGGLNLFEYTSSPLNDVDPYGLDGGSGMQPIFPRQREVFIKYQEGIVPDDMLVLDAVFLFFPVKGGRMIPIAERTAFREAGVPGHIIPHIAADPKWYETAMANRLAKRGLQGESRFGSMCPGADFVLRPVGASVNDAIEYELKTVFRTGSAGLTRGVRAVEKMISEGQARNIILDFTHQSITKEQALSIFSRVEGKGLMNPALNQLDSIWIYADDADYIWKAGTP
jgi:RHS repeat-associated protein